MAKTKTKSFTTLFDDIRAAKSFRAMYDKYVANGGDPKAVLEHLKRAFRDFMKQEYKKISSKPVR